MGKYKDTHGETRISKFLRDAKDVGVKIAPEILDIAGDITGVDALNRLSDKIKQTDDMSPEMKAQALSLLEFDKAEMEEVTKRHGADMVSDSWLSKNVRPIVLIYSWLLTSILIIADGMSLTFNVPEYYLNLLVPLTIAVTTFYFGGRDFNKFQLIKRIK